MEDKALIGCKLDRDMNTAENQKAEPGKADRDRCIYACKLHRASDPMQSSLLPICMLCSIDKLQHCQSQTPTYTIHKLPQKVCKDMHAAGWKDDAAIHLKI